MTIPAFDATTVAEHYITAWNETDAARREALLAASWTDDATYVDPLMQGRGREQISALIGAVHARYPGFRFVRDGQADGHGEHLRFSWTLGPQAQPDLIKGTNYARLSGRRLQAVTGFLDRVPAGA
ncbi:nuclear transport factor 2 family protein [Variovorax terrae]|uniref:Nuclear transport factor 2 family protein n=1 Tax=Variovorax terrae TaxID=2923278 RepID=A0A9X1VVN2_9BURK|nr:nuclear transport factor 2 family protein [Variovorax terrae]MCJ0764083.1 nuclear transport factor 2 family protein [Variovorax terrae]